MASRKIWFGPYVIDVSSYSLGELDELLTEAEVAADKIFEWMTEDEDEEA